MSLDQAKKKKKEKEKQQHTYGGHDLDSNFEFLIIKKQTIITFMDTETWGRNN